MSHEGRGRLAPGQILVFPPIEGYCDTLDGRYDLGGLRDTDGDAKQT